MPFLVSNGKFITVKDGKFATANDRSPIYIEYREGGTATGVTVNSCSASEESLYRSELSSYGSRLSGASFIRTTGTGSGTIKFYINPALTDANAPLTLLMRTGTNTWVQIFDGYTDSNSLVTTSSVSSFGPIVGLSDLYLISSDNKVLYDSGDNLLYGKEN